MLTKSNTMKCPGEWIANVTRATIKLMEYIAPDSITTRNAGDIRFGDLQFVVTWLVLLILYARRAGSCLQSCYKVTAAIYIPVADTFVINVIDHMQVIHRPIRAEKIPPEPCAGVRIAALIPIQLAAEYQQSVSSECTMPTYPVSRTTRRRVGE